MPLTPAIRPVSAISMTADRPISAPPASEAIGVKAVMAIEQGPSGFDAPLFSTFEFTNILNGKGKVGHGPGQPRRPRTASAGLGNGMIKAGLTLPLKCNRRNTGIF